MIEGIKTTEIALSRALGIDNKVICSVTDPEGFQMLSDKERYSDSIDRIRLTLEGFGYVIKEGGSEDSRYFYSSLSPERLSDANELKQVRKSLNDIANKGASMIAFIDFMSSALGIDLLPEPGNTFSRTTVEESLSRQDSSLLDAQLNRLLGAPMFNMKSRFSNITSIRERVDRILKVMSDEGMIQPDKNGIHYRCTGLFAKSVETIRKLETYLEGEDTMDSPAQQQNSLI